MIFPLWCSYNVHVLVWLLLAMPIMWACVFLFLLCVFSVFSQYCHWYLVLFCFQWNCVVSHPSFCIYGRFWWRLIILLSGSYYMFLSQVQYFVQFSEDSYGFAILVLLFMDDHGVTWSSYGNTHRECYIEVHIYHHFIAYIYTSAFQPLYPFIIPL